MHTAEGFAAMMANEIAANGVKSEYYIRALEAWLQDGAAYRTGKKAKTEKSAIQFVTAIRKVAALF